jgi:formate dehydrogenase major subunit
MKVTITIDGKQVSAESGSTVYEVCWDQGINLPAACRHPLMSPCMDQTALSSVDIQGRGVLSATTTCVQDGMVVGIDTPQAADARKTALTDMLAHHQGDCVAPCSEACPAHIDIQGYLALIAKGRPTEAMELIRETNPLPSVIGRICPRPCEAACRRSLVDQPLAICWLKRYAGDKELLDGKRPLPPMAKKNGRKVAIIGSGPAGLSAAFFLRRMGYEPTIYETLPQPGGMLRYGIPEYRLPKAVLDKEIESITDMGVTLECNKKFGEDITFDSLKENGCESVLLAVGAHKSYAMGLDGENNLKGVHLGIEFLREMGLGNEIPMGAKVAIVGGGNTAMDAARTARRLGAGQVTVLYRRSRQEMPASAHEIKEAEEEGVKFEFLAAPVKLNGDSGKLTGVSCIRMQLGEPDQSGRRRPTPVDGSEFDMELDTLICAIGQCPELEFLKTDCKCLEGKGEFCIGRGNCFTVDPETMATNMPGVFAAGDAQRGPATGVWAVSDGRRAALAMDQFLTTGEIKAIEDTAPQFTFRRAAALDQVDKSEYAHIAKQNIIPMPGLKPDERKDNFNEVENGYSDEQAMKEAARCLECGCASAGDCVLRDLATKLEIEQPEKAADFKFIAPNRLNAYIERDANKCIGCGQCDTACREIMHICALAKAGADEPAPYRHAEDVCAYCGQCAEVCPTGAITFRGSVRPEKSVTTVCPHCDVGCILDVGVRGGFITAATGGVNGPANRGAACVQGRFGMNFANNPHRITTPMIRKNGELKPASWNKALGLIAEKLSAYKGRFGIIASPYATNEDNFIAQQFARQVMGVNNIDSQTNATRAMNEALREAFGTAAAEAPLYELSTEDCILAVDTDTTEENPVAALHIKDAARRGARLIVAHPRNIDLCKFAAIWLRHKPGTESTLLLGMARYIIDNDLADKEFIAQYTTGFEEFKKSLEPLDMETVERVTGVPRERIIQAAEIYAGSHSASSIFSTALSRYSHGQDNVRALANLSLVSGHPGRPDGGLLPLRGAVNAQGAWDMGAAPNLLPGGVVITEKQGLTTEQMLNSASVPAVFIMGGRPDGQNPANPGLLQDKEFSVVMDTVLNDTARAADIVLPAAAFTEINGTVTSAERRVQIVRPVTPAPGAARPIWQAICQIATAMSAQDFTFKTASQVFDHIAASTAPYAGISHKRLEHNAMQWPCSQTGVSCTEELFDKGFLTENKRALFASLAPGRPEPSSVSGDQLVSSLTFLTSSKDAMRNSQPAYRA